MSNGDINPFTRRQVENEGRVYFLFGTTGTGKTTLIKKYLKALSRQKTFAFDIDNEYTDLTGKRFDRKKAKLEDQAAEFKSKVSELWEHNFVFSEAGIFFTHHEGYDMEMREILKSARRRGNHVFFDFHSLSEIPIAMLKFCNYLIMKKTVMETLPQIKKFSAYPEIIQNYREVMKDKNIFATKIIEPRKLIINF